MQHRIIVTIDVSAKEERPNPARPAMQSSVLTLEIPVTIEAAPSDPQVREEAIIKGLEVAAPFVRKTAIDNKIKTFSISRGQVRSVRYTPVPFRTMMDEEAIWRIFQQYRR